MLDKAGWERVQQHFDRLIELDPCQRAARLDTLALSTEDRALLEALLEAHDQADPIFDSGSAPTLLALADDDATEQDWSGRQLGPWKVEEQIGRGGMSVVHLGRRVDGQFEKTVAIKVLDAEQLAADQRHRLTEEIRILARLEHPGLARLIDSGHSDDGDPYLVMEYVQGVPLTDYIAERNISAGQRIELIIQVARALQYAHQRQVIHCDIKPSNILVTPEGQARLVDFGIAALDEDRSGTQSRFYCSPAYAAPERLNGTPPTTSQDIFALGAVLYRSLSGRNIRPHDAITGAQITDQPTPPSVATTQALEGKDAQAIDARELRGDLDAICMKAIAIDPDDRYVTVSELVADLQAWRDHRPVAARSGGRAYVLSRWLRRHSAIAVLGLLLIGSLIGGTVIALDQARQAGEQADRALASRDFLIGILEAADPVLEYGRDPPASELLRRGAERIRDQFNDQPELLIELLYIIGKTQLERGLIEDARTSLDQAVNALGPRSRHSDAANVLATRGLVAYEAGLWEESINWLEQAAEAAERNRIEKSDRHGILIQLADMQAVTRDTDSALTVIDRVLSEQPDLDQRIPALRVRGVAFQNAGDLGNAERVLLEALGLQQSIDPAHINAAKIENDLGNVYWLLRDFERSLDMHRASLQHKVEVYGELHPQTLTSLGNVAALSDAIGLHDQAQIAWRESLERLIVVHGGPVHPDIVYTRGMMALSAYLTDDLATSKSLVTEALAGRSELVDAPVSVQWLDRVAALLDFELGQGLDPAALEVDAQVCGVPAERSPLGQRLCAAWWILAASEDEPACVPDGAEREYRRLIADWPARWQERWNQAQSLCRAIVTPSA